MNVRLTKEQKIKIANSEDIFEIMRRVLMRENRLGRKKEHFWVIGLNIQSRIIYIELVSLGSQSLMVVDPIEVFCLAVQKKSPYVLFVHNHPSGDLSPSAHDRALTDKLIKGSELLNIRVFDHLIISENGYLSFLERGWIKPRETSKKP